MKYQKFRLLLLVLVLASCSRSFEIYTSGDGYRAREKYFTDRSAGIYWVNIYLLDSSSKNGKWLYKVTDIYVFGKGRHFLRKVEKNPGTRVFNACACPDTLPFLKKDSMFINRIKRIADSLNWPGADFLNSLNGFRELKK